MSDKSSDSTVRKFNREYDLYFSSIFSSVYSRTGSYHESEDICQEIFLSLFDNIESVRNTRTWLYGVMRNMISDYYSRKGKTPAEVELLVEESSAVYVNGFRDTRIIIEEILNSDETFTDERERIVFDMVAVNGFSIAEVSRHLDITYRQARYGFERASAGIADALKKRGIASIGDLL